MRTTGALVFLVLVAAACGKPLSGPPPSGDYKVYEAASQQLAVIDSRSHSVERSLPLGALSGTQHLYAIQSNALLDISPQTGATQRMLQLPGRYQLPPMTINGIPGGLSQNGAWLVVDSYEGSGSALSTASHMLVISTATWKVTDRMDLPGDFQFDAISNDGERLYLIQYLNSAEYNVRLYDLLQGRLDANIVVDKADGQQAMAGTRLSGVASPDGHWLYSIYVRAHESPFIHALSMDGPFAFCIDLPGSGYANNAAEYRWSLAMNRDGSQLFAANGVLGIVAQVEPATNYQPAVKRTVHYDTSQSVGAKGNGASGAVLSLDGHTLVVSGDRGIAWIDATTLRVSARSLGGWKVWSMAVSGDGAALYAVNDAGMIAEVSMSRGHSLAQFGGAPGQPIELVRVDGGAP
jgi:hypothetical protein